MCGIAGYFSQPQKINSGYLTEMIESIRHRGPDVLNIWHDPNKCIGLAHARLAILDLSEAGAQPMISPGQRYTIVFNGEIYNHNDIRREINQTAFQPHWRGHSDTETLLAGFEVWGIKETVQRTVGMFAMAIWDSHKEQLVLVRDRMGEKPLYYGWQGVGDNKVFIFGSELKALKVHPEFRGNITEMQFLFNYVTIAYLHLIRFIKIFLNCSLVIF